jgi:amidophosphoribosyltransferase
MCGIIGIIDKEKEVAERLMMGMMGLQHRGQDACGVITSSNNEMSIKRTKGTVSKLIENTDPAELKGKKGIGHTRYPTIGSSFNVDSQPLVINSTKRIVMAHNGNLINHFELEEDLRKHGTFLTTQVDIESLLQLFAQDYEANGDFFHAVKNVLKRAKGAYSVVGIIGGKGLFAFRDPRGIRPLVMGKKNGSYIFASETVVLQTLGYEYIRDVAPGEGILINEKMEVKNEILLQEEPAHCMFEWIYFARPDSLNEKRAVYNARLRLGEVLAEKMKGMDIDVVIPVPDTARTSAITVADTLDVKYREGLIKNRYVGRTFIMPSQEIREQMVQVKLNPVISAIEGRNIAVVDDSIVRGTTSKKIINVLRKANPKSITFVSTCPPIKHPCFYGVDFPTEEELIASKNDIEAIRKHIGADRLIYGTIEDLKTCIKRPLCTACLDGNYPCAMTEKQKKLISDDNINNRCNC